MTRFRARGFTLLELMIVVVIVGILAAVALPSYQNHIIRSARVAAQAELLELAGLQEKIFLNSNLYAFSVTANYNGTSAGGLGRTTGQTKDGRYTLSLVTDAAGATAMTAAGPTYFLRATPVATTTQKDDGVIVIDESGKRTCSLAHCGSKGNSLSW